MMRKVWILTTFLAGTFGLPKPVTEVSAVYHNSSVDRQPLMHGGSPTKKRVPYMVALTVGLPEPQFFCGGSLLTTRTILTAAHCIDVVFSEGSLDRSLRATVGTNRWNISGVRYKIAKNITHPKYPPTSDIGLLITAKRVRLSKSVHPVTLHYGFVGANVKTRVTGWGDTESGDLSMSLHQLTVNTVDGERCNAKMSELAQELEFEDWNVQPDVELCTFHSENHGTCTGDSGGPLVLEDQGWQVGIVSWGGPCAIGFPDVFVRISAYKDWLLHNIR